MFKQPLLSIVVPSYEQDKLLIKLIDSVFYDNPKDVELVIVDDCSSIEKYKKVSAYVEKSGFNIRLLRNDKNLGLTKNWNNSITEAKGEWISFICSDDYYLPGSISYIKELINRFSAPCLFIQDSSIKEEIEYIQNGVEGVNSMRFPIVSGNFWHRSITDKLGSFDERLKYSPDGEFWFRIAFYFPYIKVRRTLAFYYHYENNYMWKTWEKDDFIDQIELLSDINKKYFFTDVIDKQEIAEFEDEGIWQTIITIIGSTYRNPKRKHIYLRYLEKAQVLSNNDCKKREELNKYIRKRFLGLF